MTRKPLLILPFYFLITGFSLTPMSHVIELDAKQKQAQFLLDNPTDEPMAVEISLRERIQKEDGTEETPVAKNLAAFPPQLIIPPEEKRTVRVQWLGETPKSELAFRVVAEQLPLQVDGKKKKGSGIKMLLRYIAALYVNPGDTESNVQIKEIIPGDPLQVVVENKGSKHQLLSNAVLNLTLGKDKLQLKGDALKGLAGENVLAGSRRIFKIPANAKVTKDAKGTIKFD
jgi:fimbrial chaperone protein